MKPNNHLEKIDGRSSNLEEKLFSHSFSLMTATISRPALKPSFDQTQNLKFNQTELIARL
ncbi:hypothetical protein YC2023_103236 [Brassica napus]